MGDLLSLIGEIWTDFSARPPLDQVSIAFSIVLPIAGATGTLTWLVVRRLFQKEVGLLENEVKSLTGRLAVRTTERDTALERVRTLEAQLADVNPRDWLAAFEKDRSLGNDNRAIETLRDGFERVAPDLRKAVMELAWDQFTRGDAERPHHFSEAWRLSAIARAISIGDDVAELRDGLREIDAEIAQRTGRYDSSDPKWDVFEQAKGLDDPAAAAQTTDALIQRAQQSTRNGRYWEAERMARRAETIARRSEGPEAQRALVAGFGRVQAILLQDRREEALSAVDALLSVEERVQGPAHPGTLATRHLRADTLNRLGRREEALSAVDALLPVQEQVQGPEHPGTLVTRSRRAEILNGLGRREEALSAVDALLPVQEQVQGPEHPGTLVTRSRRAEILNGLGNLDDALNVAKAVLEALRRTQPTGVPEINQTEALIDAIEAKLADLDGAEDDDGEVQGDRPGPDRSSMERGGS